MEGGRDLLHRGAQAARHQLVSAAEPLHLPSEGCRVIMDQEDVSHHPHHVHNSLPGHGQNGFDAWDAVFLLQFLKFISR